MAAGIWHPDSRALTLIRSAVVAQPERWKKAVRRLELGGESLTRPPRGFPSDHPCLEVLKRKDYIASVPITEKQVCSPAFLRDIAAAFKTLAPLVEFTTTAMGLKF